MRAVASPLLWPVRAIGALLPDGWKGFARQLAVFVPFDIAYEASRAFAQGGRTTALKHAGEVVSAERWLGIYEEHAVQNWALHAPGFVMEVAKFTYFQCQFTITFGFVIWVYIWRHSAYTLLRNALFATFMLAVPGYILYPTAPPRLLLQEHFKDPLESATLNQQGTLVSLFGNPYAAMPSLHTATAILVGACGVLVARHKLVKLMWALYPPLVVFSIVATANHFFLDAIAGVGVLAIALTIVLALHRRKGWSLAPLHAADDRSPAGTDRSSRRRAEAADGLRPSGR
jgi:membrane-associated phospholipid phosphatase